MTQQYKDAKEWFREIGPLMSVEDLVLCILNKCSADDIECWFGVDLDDGEEEEIMGFCPRCGLEVAQDELDMCEFDIEDENEDKPNE